MKTKKNEPKNALIFFSIFERCSRNFWMEIRENIWFVKKIYSAFRVKSFKKDKKEKFLTP